MYKRQGENIRPSVQKSRDAPELIRTEKQSKDFGQNRKQQNRKRIRAEVGKESRLAEKSEAGQSGRLKENVLIYQKTEETAGEIRPAAAKSQNKNSV